MPDTARPKEPDLSPRQRWIAAQRLASGDSPRMAAAQANAKLECLQLLISEDAEFKLLIEDCREIEALDADARRARTGSLVWQTAERALADGRVTTLNTCLRALGLLQNPRAEGDDDPDPLEAFHAGLTPDQRAELATLRREEEEYERGLAAAREEEATPPPTSPTAEKEPSPQPSPSAEGEGARGEPLARRARTLSLREEGEGRGEGLSSPPAAPAPRPVATAVRSAATSSAALSGPALDPALWGPANLRGPCPPPPPEPWPSWTPGPTPAELLNAPRPNPNGPAIPVLRPAREPVPDWHRHPSGWPRPRGP